MGGDHAFEICRPRGERGLNRLSVRGDEAVQLLGMPGNRAGEFRAAVVDLSG